jgi:3-phosphoshikimate 1-carboxyvinyltransferase
MKEIKPRPAIDAVVRIPGSKSLTHRAVIASGLASGKSHIKNFLSCEDTLYTISALKELGAEISIDGEDMAISGTGGKFPHSSDRKEIFLGNSGTSYRLLLSTVALAKGEFVLTGVPRMHRRPIGDLVAALNTLGVEATCMGRDEFPPVLIKAGGIRGGRVVIRGDKSSQYVSSLLLAGPYSDKGIEIEVTGTLVSEPYVDLTLDVMEMFGIHVKRKGYSYFGVPSGQVYSPCQFSVEGDASSASYFWAAAAVTGGTTVTENIYSQKTRQGDIRLLHILEQMGCYVERKADRVLVHGGLLSGIEADMSTMPDMVPTLAAVALFADGKTVIRNVPHLRHKESDRLRAVVSEWNRLGSRIEELSDGLIIHGGTPLIGTMVDPHDDHRIAMSLAVVGLRVPGIKIRKEGCVDKSFTQFWDIWDRIQ